MPFLRGLPFISTLHVLVCLADFSVAYLHAAIPLRAPHVTCTCWRSGSLRHYPTISITRNAQREIYDSTRSKETAQPSIWEAEDCFSQIAGYVYDCLVASTRKRDAISPDSASFKSPKGITNWIDDESASRLQSYLGRIALIDVSLEINCSGLLQTC